VTIEIEGKGSATAPPALLEGASQFGPMSRPMNADEIAAFEKKYGYKPAHFAWRPMRSPSMSTRTTPSLV